MLFMQRPRWSIKACVFAAIVITALSTIGVMSFLKKSVWVELEIVTALISLFIFTFLCYVLYHGVRFDKNERYEVQMRELKVPDTPSGVDTGGVCTEIGDCFGTAGCLIGLLIDLLLSGVLIVVLAFLFWLGLGLAEFAIAAIALPLFLLFRRSLRIVVAKGRSCRGNAQRSFFYAAIYTLLGTSWFYLILLSAHAVAKLRS